MWRSCRASSTAAKEDELGGNADVDACVHAMLAKETSPVETMDGRMMVARQDEESHEQDDYQKQGKQFRRISRLLPRHAVQRNRNGLGSDNLNVVFNNGSLAAPSSITVRWLITVIPLSASTLAPSKHSLQESQRYGVIEMRSDESRQSGRRYSAGYRLLFPTPAAAAVATGVAAGGPLLAPPNPGPIPFAGPL